MSENKLLVLGIVLVILKFILAVFKFAFWVAFIYYSISLLTNYSQDSLFHAIWYGILLLLLRDDD